jgi:hypothetical protein
MASKTKNLRDEAIKAAGDYVRVTKRGWLGDLQRKDPERYAAVVALIEDWKAGDKELRDAFKTSKALASWISDQDWCTSTRVSVEKALYG